MNKNEIQKGSGEIVERRQLVERNPSFLAYTIAPKDEVKGFSFGVLPMSNVIGRWRSVLEGGHNIHLYSREQFSTEKMNLSLVKLSEEKDSVVIMHFLRFDKHIPDADIATDPNIEQNYEDWDIEKLSDMANLGESHTEIKYCVCAYDLENEIFIWQRNDHISTSLLSRFISQEIKDKAKLKPTTYADTVNSLPFIDMQEVSLSYDARNIYPIAAEIRQEAGLSNDDIDEIVETLKELSSLTRKFSSRQNGVSVKLLVKSRGSELSLENGFFYRFGKIIQKYLHGPNASMRVKGHLKGSENNSDNDIDQMRVLDICRNLMSVNSTAMIDDKATFIKNIERMEKCAFDAVFAMRMNYIK